MKVIIIALLVLMIPSTVFAQESNDQIPEWYQTNVTWWVHNEITDDEFIQGIHYLVKTEILNSTKPLSELSVKNYETTVNNVGRYTVDSQVKLPHLLDATDDQDCMLKARSDDGRISSLEKGYCEHKHRTWIGCELDDYTLECGYSLTENKYYANYDPEKKQHTNYDPEKIYPDRTYEPGSGSYIEGMSQKRMYGLMEYYGNQWYKSGMSMSALDRYTTQFLNDIDRAYGIR